MVMIRYGIDDVEIDGSSIDLNADVGESFGSWHLGEDEAVLGQVTSANIACGAHAGDPSIMRRTCESAVRFGTTVGAHVGYPDLAGFGRRFLDMTTDDLSDCIVYQIGALRAIAEASGTDVRYVKPHGALYNVMSQHKAHGDAVISALTRLGGHLPLVVLAGSAMEDRVRQAGLHVVREAFLDRGYLPDGRLIPRGEPGAMLVEPREVIERARLLARELPLPLSDGSTMIVKADTLCLHGDTPGSSMLLAAAREALESDGIAVTAFA